jgi:DeoR/GlpR family transcriptional regulator of sugar metabolism
MLSRERQETIVALLDDEDSISVAELVNRFSVSEMTVRRDLEELGRRGLIKRVHGGAMSARGRGYERPLQKRATAHSEPKARIGRAAAELVAAGESIAIDVGTTTFEMARNLIERANITVITPSLNIACLLADEPGLRLIITGGIVRHGERSLIGRLAEDAFARFHVDKLFLAVGCIDFEAGLTEFNLEDAQVKQEMIRSAREVILLADSSKLGQVAFASVAPLAAVRRWVTDDGLPEDARERLGREGIEVIIA